MAQVYIGWEDGEFFIWGMDVVTCLDPKLERFKVTEVPDDLVSRYNRNLLEANGLQEEISKFTSAPVA